MSLEKMSFEELLSMAHGMLIMGKQIPDDLADYMSDRSPVYFAVFTLT